MQRLGFTDLCPDDRPVPSDALNLSESRDYWVVSGATFYHNGQKKRVEFNLESLRVGQSVGCSINRGELRYFIDGVDQGVAWTGLPTDRPMWGIADICGRAIKIKSEFSFGEYQNGYINLFITTLAKFITI